MRGLRCLRCLLFQFRSEVRPGEPGPERAVYLDGRSDDVATQPIGGCVLGVHESSFGTEGNKGNEERQKEDFEPFRYVTLVVGAILPSPFPSSRKIPVFRADDRRDPWSRVGRLTSGGNPFFQRAASSGLAMNPWSGILEIR